MVYCFLKPRLKSWPSFSPNGALSLNPGELPWVARNNSVLRPEGPREFHIP